MNLLEKMRSRLIEIQKSDNATERDTLKVAVSNIESVASSKSQNNKPVTQDQMVNIVRQIVNGNKDAMHMISTKGQQDSDYYKKLEAENLILEPYLPKMIDHSTLKSLLVAQIENLKAAKNDGMGNGIAMKYLKSPGVLPEGMALDGNVVAEVVKEIRNEL